MHYILIISSIHSHTFTHIVLKNCLTAMQIHLDFHLNKFKSLKSVKAFLGKSFATHFKVLAYATMPVWYKYIDNCMVTMKYIQLLCRNIEEKVVIKLDLLNGAVIVWKCITKLTQQ